MAGTLNEAKDSKASGGTLEDRLRQSGEAGTDEKKKPGWGQWVYETLVPSSRDVFRMGGAAIGGTTGTLGGPAGLAIGGALGGAGGEGLYQIIEGLRGASDAPKTTSESLAGIAEAGTLGELQEWGGPVISKGISKVAESSVAKSVQRILKPATDSMKEAIESASMDLARQMPVALTRKRLLTKVQPLVDTMRQAVDTAYATVRTQKPSLVVPTDPILNVIQNAKAAEFVQGQPIPESRPLIQLYDDMIAFLSRQTAGPPRLISRATTTQVATGIRNASGQMTYRTVWTPAQYAPTTQTVARQMTLDEFRQIKTRWDKAINYARSSLSRQPEREEAISKGADAIRALQHQISPELAVADHTFSIWKDALDALTKTTRSDIGRDPKFDMGRFLGHTGVAGGLGYALGGVTGAELVGGAEIIGTAAQHIMQSTAFRTATMSTKQNVIRLLNQGKTQKAVGFLMSQTASKTLRAGETVLLPKTRDQLTPPAQ